MIHGFIIPVDDRSSEIDYIVLSRFGVFVIEVKYWTGHIIVSGEDWYRAAEEWGEKYPIINPILQNNGHIKALSSFLELPEESFFNMVVMAGTSRFRGIKPEGVYSQKDMVRFIRSKDQAILDPSMAIALFQDVLINGLPPTRENMQDHVLRIKCKR